MKAGRIIALLMGLTLMALLLPMQATAAGAAPGIVMGGAVTKGSAIVMAGTEWDVVLNTTSMGGSDGRLLMTSGVKSAGTSYYGTQMDYINTFYDNSFADLEKAAVMSTSKTDPTGNYARIWFADSGLNGAKLFALSASEATSYFGSDTERRPGSWWLRSLTLGDVNTAGVVQVDGSVAVFNSNTNIGFGVRPAFNLNLSSVLFSSAAEGGKSSGAEGASIIAIPSNTTGMWKLTLRDTSRGFTAVHAVTDITKAAYGYDDWRVHISYNGAATGNKEYVSALLCDAHDRALYYGHLAAGFASGTVELALPNGLGVGEYTLHVFSEQCNGDYRTDYASAFADIPLTVTGETHTVTFVTGSWGSALEAQTVGHGSLAVEPEPSSQTGAVFIGWTTSTGEQYDFATPVTSDITLYAAWQTANRVSVSVSGGEGVTYILSGSDDGTTYARGGSCEVTVPLGVDYTLAIYPPDGYVFSGRYRYEGNGILAEPDPQWVPFSSASLAFSLPAGTYSIELEFSKAPVLTVNVSPDDMAGVHWSLCDAADLPNNYAVGAMLPVPVDGMASPENELTLTLAPPSGWSCDGSIDNNGEVTQIYDGRESYTFTAKGAVTVTLNFYDKATHHTIRFFNGSALVASQQVVHSIPQSYFTLKPYDNTSADIFDGWNTRPDGSGDPYADGASIKVVECSSPLILSLYAQWIPAFAVTFNENDGQGTMDKFRLPKSNATGTLPICAFTRSGYAFAGWNTKANGSGTPYADGAEVTLTKNLPLYAQWTSAWTVSFDANGGEGEMTGLPVAKGASATLPAGALTREGYDFAGWAKTAGGAAAFSDGAQITPAADMTLYAVWTPHIYSVAYELNGGALPQGVGNPASYTIESASVTLNAPKKAGFVFGGWYLDAEFTHGATGIGQGSTGDKTFYAKWEEITVTFGPASFTLPASLTTIGKNAFKDDTSITIVDAHSCTYIGAEAFSGCKSLTQIRVHKNCQIDNTAFTDCGGTVFIFAPAGGDAEAWCEGRTGVVFVPESVPPRAGKGGTR